MIWMSRIDPFECHYGAATWAVRQILIEWSATDWFEPPEPEAEAGARAAFEDHHRRAHAYAPDLFATRLDVRTIHGDWAGFTELCSRFSNSISDGNNRGSVRWRFNKWIQIGSPTAAIPAKNHGAKKPIKVEKSGVRSQNGRGAYSDS